MKKNKSYNLYFVNRVNRLKKSHPTLVNPLINPFYEL